MYDCPVAAGLGCVHFEEAEGDPTDLPMLEYERLHDGLMADYLSRVYTHRVRSLAPEGSAWTKRQAELAAFYGEEDGADVSEADLEAYEKERDALIAQRKRREEERAARAERSKEQKALERAKMGIKTVVEKAQEAVAAQGNVASSVVDELKLPGKGPRMRRRPRPKPAEQTSGERPNPDPKKKRRRRRRRKPKGGGPAA